MSERGAGPESLSFNPEAAADVPERDAVVSRAQEERAALFSHVLVEAGSGGKPSLISRKVWNFIPLAGDAVMAYRAFTGIEKGLQLPKSSRVLYAAAATSTICALMYLKGGHLEAATAAHLASDVFTKAEVLVPQLIKAAADKVRELNPQLSGIFAATASWVAEHKEQLSGLKEIFDDSVLTLDINEQEPE